MRKYEVLQQHWHLAQNDEVGGWAVTNYNVQFTSQLDHRLGQVIVADALNENVARHIVNLHNRELDSQAEDVVHRYFDTVEIRLAKGDTKLMIRSTVSKDSPLVAYEHTLQQAVGRLMSKLRKGTGG